MYYRFKNTIGKGTVNNGLANAGVGYIVLPTNFTRDDYIKHCFKNKTVCVKTENFEFIQDAVVDEDVLQRLEFPDGEKLMGSCIGWVRIAKHSQPMIVGIFGLKNTGNEIENENSFHITRKFKGNFVSIKGEANEGNLTIGVHGQDENSGNLKIHVTNDNEHPSSNNMELYVQGDISIKAEKDLNVEIGNELNITVSDLEKSKNQTVVSYKFGNGLNINDEFGNKISLNKNGLDIKFNGLGKLHRTDNTQPAVLGDQLESILDQMMDIISSQNDYLIQAVPTAASLSPTIAALKKLISSIKSQNVQID